MSLSPSLPTTPLESAAAVLALLDRWEAAGWLRPLDAALARFLHEQTPDAPPLVLLAAALASHQAGRGHVCLDAPSLLADPDRSLSLPPEDSAPPPSAETEPLPRPAHGLAGYELDSFLAGLHHPDLIAEVGTAEGHSTDATPLVLDGPRLYLRRYWASEGRIAATLGQRMAAVDHWRAELDPKATRDWLDRLFGKPSAETTDWQRQACAVAAGSGFTVITGGPGTGKTTTVVRLLALLQGLRRDAGDRPLRIRMAAPTGKAAARLNDSVAGAVGGLPLPDEDLRATIPVAVTTLHRLLGVRPGSRHFRHHRDNLLPVEVLVVDEASMIDVELMAATLDALPPRARLVLLGDRDQLASVEAGAVLGELCRRADGGHYTPATADWLAEVSGQGLPSEHMDAAGLALDQHIVMLRHSHRFGGDSGIGRLAAAVNAGDGAAALEQLAAGGQDELAHLPLNGHDHALLELAVEGARPWLAALRDQRPAADAAPQAWDDWARELLDQHGRFQLLAALRRGPWGVEQLNRRIAEALESAGLIRRDGPWYPGRPVMVTRNDYNLGLINGDVGLALAVPETEGDGRRTTRLRVAFPAGDGSGAIRWILPARLDHVETVHAMTVHKAQGSEFDHAALVLPDAPSPILTRELIYTAITRARARFILAAANERVLSQAVAARVTRSAGLHPRLLAYP